MGNFEVNLVAATLVECCNSQCENYGIDTEKFGAFTSMSEDCQLVILWRFTTILADGVTSRMVPYIDFLDDVKAGETICEHTIDDFGIELTENQKSVFQEFEPKFAVIRRIQHVQNKIESLKEEIQF